MDKQDLIALLAKYQIDAQKKLQAEAVAAVGLVVGTQLDEEVDALSRLADLADGVARGLNSRAIALCEVFKGDSYDVRYGVLQMTHYTNAKELLMQRLLTAFVRTPAYKAQRNALDEKFTAAIRKVSSMRNPTKLLELAKDLGIVVDAITGATVASGVDTVFVRETINKVKELT